MSCLFQDDILEGGEEQTNGHRKQGRQTVKNLTVVQVEAPVPFGISPRSRKRT